MSELFPSPQCLMVTYITKPNLFFLKKKKTSLVNVHRLGHGRKQRPLMVLET